MTPQEKQLLQNIAYRLNKLERSDRYSFSKLLQLADGVNLDVGTGAGTRIGTSASEKIGFFGAAPVAQPAAISAPSGGSTVDSAARTAIGTIISTLHSVGLTQ
jgi:hypothetical protein